MDTLVAGLEEEPRALLLTHIHLDHAGASGSLVRRFPGLRVYVHESGAQHLVDPAKLLESATRLYGDDMDRLWEDVLPVPAESVVALVGGESIEGFRVAHAPGHARHHVVYLHEATWLSHDLPRASRDFVERQLVKYGAILFRGFPVKDSDDFEQFGMAVSDNLLEYKERSSPRSQVGENVYTSTDYPPSQKIFPHNEHSYAVTFPLKLFFFCETPATRGGETPIGDTRKIAQRIRPEIRERFRQRKWMYMRNFGYGMGVPWRKAFATSDKSVVEAYAELNKIDLEWKDNDCLPRRFNSGRSR